MLYKRLLFIPWMVSDMIFIIIMVIVFSSWTFLSFFVGWLVAIVFPFVSGLLLGVCIFFWRQVQFTFVVLGETDRGIRALRKQQAEYKPVQRQGEHSDQGETLTMPCEWKQELIDCCFEPGICCCGMCFPSCLTYRSANDLGKSGLLYFLLACCVPCIPTLLLRQEAREVLH